MTLDVTLSRRSPGGTGNSCHSKHLALLRRALLHHDIAILLLPARCEWLVHVASPGVSATLQHWHAALAACDGRVLYHTLLLLRHTLLPYPDAPWLHRTLFQYCDVARSGVASHVMSLTHVVTPHTMCYVTCAGLCHDCTALSCTALPCTALYCRL